jgi:hypothetical protein
MASEVDRTGMTPEQKAGLAAGAVFAVAGLAISLIRRRKKQKSPVQETAERIAENPSLKSLFSSAKDALEDARDRFDPKTIEMAKAELTRQAEHVPSVWKSEVQPQAKDLAERALEIAHRVREEGGERSRELATRWDKEYAPAAKSIADEAVSEADEILRAAREKAGHISEVARKDYLPKVAPLAAAAGGAIASAVSEGSEKLSKQIKDGSLPKVELPKKSDLKAGVGTSPGVLRRTGAGVKDATGQILMIGFWGAALGAVVYYGLLDEERRAKVRAFFSDSYEQITELIEDFKDDEEFTTVNQDERF